MCGRRSSSIAQIFAAARPGSTAVPDGARRCAALPACLPAGEQASIHPSIPHNLGDLLARPRQPPPAESASTSLSGQPEPAHAATVRPQGAPSIAVQSVPRLPAENSLLWHSQAPANGSAPSAHQALLAVLAPPAGIPIPIHRQLPWLPAPRVPLAITAMRQAVRGEADAGGVDYRHN